MRGTIGRAGVVALVVAVIGGIGASASIAEPPPDNPNKACPAPHPGQGIPPFCTDTGQAATGGGGGGVTIVLLPGEGPRGVWCVGTTPLSLVIIGGSATILPPGAAVNLLIGQGLALEAEGVVTAAFFVPGLGAVCSGFNGVKYVANQPLVKVNNLGVSTPGDTGLIYWLGHAA